MASKKLTGPVLGPSPARDLYVARIGSALNPRRISTILTQADTGQPAQWHDLLNELRQKHAALHSVLQTRESALLGCPWSLTAPVPLGKRKASKRSEKNAALVTSWLKEVVNLNGGMAHLLDGIYKGYSVCEVAWKKKGRYIVPKALEPKQGRRFAFDNEQRLRWYDDGLRPFPGDDFLAQYPRRFLVHQPRVNGDSPTREGLGRVLVWLACFANWAWRDWMLFGELFGKPWRILKLDRNKVQTEDEEAAESIVQDATSSTSILIYENMTFEVKWPDAPGGAGASPAPGIIDKADAGIALATLGQLGTTGEVQNGLGGRGDAREKVRGDILESDAEALAATMQQLIAWIYEVNFGPNEPVALFAFDTADEADGEKASKTLDTAHNKLKMRVPVAHAHRVLGIPQPAPGEPCLGDDADASAGTEEDKAQEEDKPPQTDTTEPTDTPQDVPAEDE